MQMLMEDLEIEVVKIHVVETEAVMAEVALIELVEVRFEFALLVGTVPQWGTSGHLQLIAK